LNRFSVNDIFTYLHTLSPLLVLCAVFAIAFIENIFPPSPSDVIIVFSGSLVAIARVGFVETLLAATAGSTLGFILMYTLGDWFGVRILEQGKISFIPAESVRKVDDWFRRYGYWIIIANRFLAGTRAVVSFFAGMAEISLPITTLLCFVSALAWNAILIGGGYALGNNWERIGFYLSTYSQVVTGVVVLLAIAYLARYFFKRANTRKGS
jgi:membrane protein DedA with SNARE-associated domain